MTLITGLLSLRIFISPHALAPSCACHSSPTAASASSEFFDALAAPLCLRDATPNLLPKRRSLSWPDDAVTTAAAATAAAAAAAHLVPKDESWLPLTAAAVMITAHDEITLQKILNFVGGGGGGGDLRDNAPRLVAGTCGGSRGPNSIRKDEEFIVFENCMAYDERFRTLDDLGALLQLQRHGASHWHQPVYNNSLCEQRLLLLSSPLFSSPPLPPPPSPPAALLCICRSHDTSHVPRTSHHQTNKHAPHAQLNHAFVFVSVLTLPTGLVPVVSTF
jgi:hypothetical protein